MNDNVDKGCVALWLAWFAIISLVSFAVTGVLLWAVIELVQWVTSK